MLTLFGNTVVRRTYVELRHESKVSKSKYCLRIPPFIIK